MIMRPWIISICKSGGRVRSGGSEDVENVFMANAHGKHAARDCDKDYWNSLYFG